jgi:AAA domain
MNAQPLTPTPEERATLSKTLDEKNIRLIAELREELKMWREPVIGYRLVRADKDHWWKPRGFDGKLLQVDIPTVSSREEAEALADQGIPCWISDGQVKLFGPTLLFQMVEDAVEFRKREFELTMADVEARENSRLKTVTDMLKTPEIDWLVQDKIHRTGLCQIFGASYSGKTLLVLDLVMSWCAGLPEWQGYKLNNNGEPQQAVYVAAEGGAALSVHVDAWLKYHADVAPSRLDGLVFLDGGQGDHMFLSVGKDGVDEADSWTRFKHEIIVSNLVPSLMVFDTQIDLAPGVDENSNTDMVGVLREVKRLGDSYGFMAIVIHHTGHDGNKARGASGMMGKCDVQAKLTTIGEKSGKAKLEWTKVKGRAVPQDTVSYHIKGYELLPDLDSEGAVCVPIDKISAAHADVSVKTPSVETQRLIMNALASGPLSIRALSEAVHIDRNTKTFKDALEWMTYSNYLTQSKEGRSSKVDLHPLAVAPEAPAA